MRNLSPAKQKILLLLFGGLAFGFSYNPKNQFKILKDLSREWKRIDERELRKNINQLYQTKLIEKKENSDGTTTITLTEKGKNRALTYNFDNIKIEKENWDRKWRAVIFDIPEYKRRGRDALREKIKKMGFCELQKSVWIYPYNCKDQIDFVVELFDLKRYVRFAVMESIDNELHFKNKFNLL